MNWYVWAMTLEICSRGLTNVIDQFILLHWSVYLSVSSYYPPSSDFGGDCYEDKWGSCWATSFGYHLYYGRATCSYQCFGGDHRWFGDNKSSIEEKLCYHGIQHGTSLNAVSNGSHNADALHWDSLGAHWTFVFTDWISLLLWSLLSLRSLYLWCCQWDI